MLDIKMMLIFVSVYVFISFLFCLIFLFCLLALKVEVVKIECDWVDLLNALLYPRSKQHVYIRVYNKYKHMYQKSRNITSNMTFTDRPDQLLNCIDSLV